MNRISIETKLSPLSVRVRFGDQMPAAKARLARGVAVLCSYPRSGNTWMRFLLANLLSKERMVYGPDVQAIVPDIYKLKAKDLDGERLPVIFKSHEAFRPDYDKVVYLYRDPRDVMVSYYHYGRGMGIVDDMVSIDEYCRKFVGRASLAGLDYGNWAEHIGSWFGAREHDEGFLPVAYEKLRSAPEQEILRIAEFLDIAHDNASVRRAIENADADRMRRMEAAGDLGYKKSWKKKFASNFSFVRAAKAGTWRDEIDSETVGIIEAAFEKPMRRLGYL